MPTRVLAVVVVAAVGLAATATGTATTARDQLRLDMPTLADIGKAGAIPDRTVPLLPRPQGVAYRPARTSAAQGQPLAIFISESYPEDPTRVQRWLDFFRALVHGSEMRGLTVYLSPLIEVQSVCGFDALACYSPQHGTMFAPGDDPNPNTTAEAVIAHEYGHHIAATRENWPWDSVYWGPKRWASYEHVCRESRNGRMHPNQAQTPNQYRLNPGEGFAEAYRVLNERRAGRPETAWRIVSRVFYPDAGALGAIQQDVVQPWRRGTTVTLRGSFPSARGRARTFSVETTLDGELLARVHAPPTARLRLELTTASGNPAGRVTVAGGTRLVRATVCGARSYRLRIVRLAGFGSFRVTVAKP